MRTCATLTLRLSVAALLILTGCTSGSPRTEATSPATTAGAQQLDTFEKIGDAIGCLSLSNAEPQTTDIKDNKYCAFEHPAREGDDQLVIYQYEDVARRDKSLKAGIIYNEQSFLVLSDTWAIAGSPRNLRKVKAVIGTGDLRSPDQDTNAGSRPGDGVGPGDPDPTADAPTGKVVPFGKSARYGNEKVQVAKLYCNGIKGSGDPNKKFNSCRLTRAINGYEAHKGKVYYFVAFRWKNAGKAPTEPTDFGTLVTKDYVEYDADAEVSNAFTASARGNSDNFSTDSKMNPGTSGRIILAYEIPKSATVKYVNWGKPDLSDGDPEYAFEVK